MDKERTGRSRAFEELERFAERRRRADEQTALIAAPPPWVERGVIYLALSALGITLAVLYFGRVQTTVQATGKILPQGDVLSLQAAQSGIVLDVPANLGDFLPAGAVVARIDASDVSLNLAATRHEQTIDEEELRVLRASVALLDTVLANPARVLDERRAGAVAASTYPLLNSLEDAQIQLDAALQDERLLPERRRQLEGERALTIERLALLERTLDGHRKALAAEEAALVRKREERDSVRRLADRKLLSVVELNAAEERYRAAETAALGSRQRVDEIELEISKTKLQLTELQTRLAALENDGHAELRRARTQYAQAVANLRQEHESLRTRVRGLESKIQQASQHVTVTEGRLQLAVVTMPVAGTIAELKVRNAGELVTAGSTIATVVPAGVPLIVEASPTNKDVGFIRPGVEGRIKVEAFPFQQFGTARARVTRVLPAVGSNSSFLVQLELVDETLRANGTEYRLFPGLSVEADLITGRQRLLDVLMQGGDDEGTTSR